MTHTLPRIHLAVDNCFASKRWTSPDAWMREISALGVRNIEAGADTELDPLYLGREYLDRWKADVFEARERHGCRVVNLYSGHGTYATLGLAHPDREVRKRFLGAWLAPMLRSAAELEAGMGFFFHALSQEVLADPDRYRAELDELVETLAKVARFHEGLGNPRPVGLEQMYTPHQPPWTIAGSRELLRRVYAAAGAPLYLTIDTGHQTAQYRYQRPAREDIATAIASVRETGRLPLRWLGPDPVLAEIRHAAEAPTREDAVRAEELAASLDAYPYLFAAPEDSDPYAWLRALAGWSPIIHLQQTDGSYSAHLPFTEAENSEGVIEGRAVLDAIRDHYRGSGDTASPDRDAGLPPRVEDIYLTIEVFAGTAETPTGIRRKMAGSVEYWRRFVPEDGLRLDELPERA